MTKTQTEQLAKNAADKNEALQTANAFDLEKVDCSTRRRTALEHAQIATTTCGDLGKWGEVFIETYVDRATGIWGSKIKQLENARRAFKTASSGLTLEQAEAKIVALAMSFNFRGARIDGSGLEIMRGDRDGARLYWSFDRTDDATINPDDPTQRVNHYALRLEISTCGTTYSPARMALVNKIQSELLEAASEIDATMSRERVQSTWGVPEAIVVAEVL